MNKLKNRELLTVSLLTFGPKCVHHDKQNFCVKVIFVNKYVRHNF